MSAPLPHVDASVPELEPLGPGPRLRRARELAEIGLEEVAARLHLDAATIEALESNSYATLPAPTFVRGYLRGYARLVGLSQEQVVDEFDSQGLAPPALVADISEGPQARTTDLAVRLATWAILGALVILVVMWWNSQNTGVFSESPSPGAAPGTPADPLAPAPGTSTGTSTTGRGMSAATTGTSSATPGAGTAAPGISAVAPASELATPPSDTTIAGAAPVTEPVARPGGTDAVDGARVTAPETALQPPLSAPAADAPSGGAARTAPSAEATGTVAADGATDGATDSATDSDAEAPAADLARSDDRAPADGGAGAGEADSPAVPRAAPSTAAGEEHLVMRFAAESWVEVYDRDERRLYFNLVQPGATIDVSGPAPLRVLLGRAEGVEVSRNGAPFDIAPHTSRGIARFSIGQSGGDAPE